MRLAHDARTLIVALACGLAGVTSAGASNFTVTPTEVDLSAAKTSALVTLRNGGKAPLRFEITAFTWSEAPDGQMTLAPTSDVTFFPKLVELGPGQSRNIRLGVTGAPGSMERSYRLFVEELPDSSRPAANAVMIRTKLGVPVFVRPEKPARTAVVESVTVEGNKIRTTIHNTGTLHISVDGLTVRGMSTAGAATFTREVPGWYVLPGATRVFDTPLTSGECRGLATVAVEVRAHNSVFKGSGPVPAGACSATP